MTRLKRISRIHLVPKREGFNKRAYASILDVNKVRMLWRDILVALREFLKNATEKYQKKVPRYLYLKAIGDLITFFFRMTLVHEVLPYDCKQGEVNRFRGNISYLLYNAITDYELSGIKREEIFFSSEKYWSLPKRANINPSEFVDKILEKMEIPLEKAENIYYAYKKYQKIKEALIDIPADTRPIYNSSSLIIHLLTTGAIAWALYYNRQICGHELPKEQKEKALCNLFLVRLAGLLHDIGKPIDWMEHVDASLREIDMLLSDILEKDELEKVKELVKYHHAKEIPRDASHLASEIKILKEADEISASVDRLQVIVETVINDTKLKDNLARVLGEKANHVFSLLERLKGKEENVKWEDTIELYELLGVKAKEVMEEIAKSVRRAIIKVIEETDKREDLTPISDIILVTVDTRGIQSFIYSSSKLDEVVGGSRLIAMITEYEIPAKLCVNEPYVPLEAILVCGGGNLTLLLPNCKDLLEKVYRVINETYGHGFYKGLSCVKAYSEFYTLIPLTLSKLFRKLTLSKLTPKKSNIIPTIFRLCDSCNKNSASRKVVHSKEEELILCDACTFKKIFGRALHFRAKWDDIDGDKKYKYSSELPYKEYSPYIMEFIAGHGPWSLEDSEKKQGIKGEIENLQRRKERLHEIISKTGDKTRVKINEFLDLAVLKADGNIMGYYMGLSISLTHYIEKSLRIDMALKTGIKTFLKVFSNVCDKYLQNGCSFAQTWIDRVYLGIIYAAGDDFLAILPSWLAIPFAIILITEFYYELGGDATLSAAIVSGSPKFPIWSLFESAEELLAFLKSKYRNFFSKIYTDNEQVPYGAIIFESSEAPAFSRYALKRYMIRLIEQGLRHHGYFIWDANKNNSIFNIINLISTTSTTFDENLYHTLLEEILKIFLASDESLSSKCFWRTKEDIKRIASVIREILTVIREYYTKFNNIDSAFQVAVAYIIRQMARESKEKSEYYKRIFKTFIANTSDPKKSVPYVDVLKLLKIIGGGRL